MTDERRDIGWRLENWARVVKPGGPRVASSQTGVICERLRHAAEGTAAPTGERRTLDEADGWLLEEGMPQLETKHRILLWWCYIRNAPPEIVCTRMGIPRRPATEFVQHFRQAQAAIEAIVDTLIKKNDSVKNS